MIRIITVVVGGISAAAVVVVALLMNTSVVAPFYEAMGSTAGAELGTTANEAVRMRFALFMLGSALIVIPVSIGLWLFMGNNGRRGGGRYRQREPPRRP